MVNEAYTPSEEEEQILSLLTDGREQGDPWGRANPKYITETLGMKRQYVNESLGNLVAAGWLRKPVTGLYEFVEDPRENES